MKTAKLSSKSLHGDILTAAAPLLKRHGTGAAPVDEIMKAAGLTSGALYSRFKNKEDLCTQAICRSLDAMLDGWGAIVRERGMEGLKQIVSRYLTEAHAAEVSDGCTFAALGSDMAKASPRAKKAYELRIHALVQIVADGLGAGSERARRPKAQHLLSTMLGALTFARAMDDPGAADELLSQVKARALRDLDEG